MFWCYSIFIVDFKFLACLVGYPNPQPLPPGIVYFSKGPPSISCKVMIAGDRNEAHRGVLNVPPPIKGILFIQNFLNFDDIV